MLYYFSPRHQDGGGENQGGKDLARISICQKHLGVFSFCKLYKWFIKNFNRITILLTSML